MFKLLKKLLKRTAPRKRLDLRFVSYKEAEKLLSTGWTIAKEENTNQVFGMVYLELLETR